MIAHRDKATKQLVVWYDPEDVEGELLISDVEIKGKKVEVEKVQLAGVKVAGFNTRIKHQAARQHGQATVASLEQANPEGVPGDVYLYDDKRIAVEMPPEMAALAQHGKRPLVGLPALESQLQQHAGVAGGEATVTAAQLLEMIGKAERGEVYGQ